MTRVCMVATTVLLAMSVAGCAQTTSGAPSTATPASSGAGSPDFFPKSASGLASLLDSGAHSVSSLHLSFSVATGGRTLTADGDETAQNGAMKDLSLVETIPDVGALKLIIVGDQTYAQLPASLRASSKPWVLVRANSSQSAVRTLYTSLQGSRKSASLDTAAVFAHAATHVVFLGTPKLDGIDTAHYRVTVETARLPATYPGRGDLETAGITEIPVELWVDGEGRPHLITEQVSVNGVSVHTEVRFGNYNAVVTIAAPPASQVDTN